MSARSHDSIRTAVANSTVAFVLAALLNSALHEGAHAVAGRAAGLTPTISPFSVDFDPEGIPSQQIITAAAGPLFSLVLGLALMVLTRRIGRGIGRLILLWLAFMAVMNFAGYCFIAPFARAGDTGKVLTLLGAPQWTFLLVSALGAVIEIWLARRFAVELKRYARDLHQERQLAFFPWLIGTAIVIGLSFVELLLLGVPLEIKILVLAYAVATGIFAPMQFIFSGRVRNRYEGLLLRPVPIGTLILTVVSAAVGIGVCAVGGIRLG